MKRATKETDPATPQTRKRKPAQNIVSIPKRSRKVTASGGSSSPTTTSTKTKKSTELLKKAVGSKATTAESSSSKTLPARSQVTPTPTKKTLIQTPPYCGTPSTVDTSNYSTTSDASTTQATSRRVINARPQQRYEIFVCGSGLRGELGLGPNNPRGNTNDATIARTPLLHPYLDSRSVGVVQVALGLNHAVALTYDGSVLTWGSNYFGALGRPTRNYTKTDSSKARKGGKLPSDYTSDGSRSGNWNDSDSELATDGIIALAKPGLTPLDESEAIPRRVSFKNVMKTGEEIVQVAATDHASFALSSKGIVYGWGVFLNDDGALGISKSRIQQKYYRSSAVIPADQLIALSPEKIDCPDNVCKVSGGANHLVFVDSIGDLWALGAGGQGQLGRRLITRFQAEALVARQVGSRMRVDRVRTGSHHSYAIDKKKRVFSWGLNNYGQTGSRTDHLEHDDAFQILQPIRIEGFGSSHVVGIDGGMHHGIACTEDGSVITWGRCDDAQIGLERSILDKMDEASFVLDANKRRCVSLEKVIVPDFHAAVAVAAGRDNCFVVDGENHLWAWGYGGEYQTGLNTRESQAVPRRVRGELTDDDEVAWVESRGSFTFIGVAA
ncbi:hypothetical protein BROUX41_003402 [Berkeleyomyces rouxiae]|uniref:uncharacterized protein n=1 Tax=Berkeleyomyces rouxiae TaxID=2035830 RepID=UPI003B814034